MFFVKFGTYSASLDKVALISGLTLAFLFGGWSQLLTALLVLQFLDILVATLVEGKNNNLSSKIVKLGIKKKAGGWIALILANVIDTVLFKGQPIAVTGLVFVLISNEGLTIIEKLNVLGVPIPDFITKYLEQIRDQSDVKEAILGEPPAVELKKVIVETEERTQQELYSESYLEKKDI